MDVTTRLGHLMDFGDGPFEIYIENTKEIVHDVWELFKVTDEYLQGGNWSMVGAYKISIV